MRDRVYAVSRGDLEKSAVALHLDNNPDHEIDWETIDILDHEVDKGKRLFKEMIYIGKQERAMNRNDDLNYFPRSYLPLLPII